ncbi:hypothetical protein [Streptomyces boncukensis]|uniref:Uncharacterized protein n=1 Tax=Streptomyces boncukensis TaxID=2711219 RepID=A0A6G4WWD2_9ACTN|nr:hypothetical protein [Streptomyces boncukensis]NGO69162.1 hypothetical protein [Streptomyces boncukensis]
MADDRAGLRARYIAALKGAHRTHPCPVLGHTYWSGCVHYDASGRFAGVGSCHTARRADAVLAVRDEEMEELRAELVAELAQHQFTLRQRNARSVRLLQLRDLAVQGDVEALTTAAQDLGAASVADHRPGDGEQDQLAAELAARPTRAEVLREAADVIDADSSISAAVHATAALRRLALADEAQADAGPTPLRWGLDDIEYGDDDSVTVLLSGPAGEPYVLELSSDRAVILSDDLAGPEAGEGDV